MEPSDLNSTVLEIKKRVVKNFDRSNWQDIGFITDNVNLINDHPRLLRSFSFGDDDYEGNAALVLLEILKKDKLNLKKIQEYLDNKFGDSSSFISAKPSARRITFFPNVFDIPDVEGRADLVAVMMPFGGFDAVYDAIKKSCSNANLDCLRADDIWDESTFIQDIVNLIFQARIVVCDFSNRNPNVFYETGIAHTLGKEVVPITQSLNDIPSDLQHHRALSYLKNTEGLENLTKELTSRLQTLAKRD